MCCTPSEAAAPTRWPSPAPITSASRASAGLSGSSSRWMSNSWSRPGVMDVARSRLVMRPIAGPAAALHRQAAISRREAVPEAGVRLQLRAGGADGRIPAPFGRCVAVKMTSKGPVFYAGRAHRNRRQTVHDAEVPHHGRGCRQGTAEPALRQRKLTVRSSRSGTTHASHRWDGSCAGSASTNCRSSSTCCGRR